MFCVDKIKYEHLAILSNLKSCQFALEYAVKAQTSLSLLSRFCGSRITTAHEQQSCRFQSYAKTVDLLESEDSFIFCLSARLAGKFRHFFTTTDVSEFCISIDEFCLGIQLFVMVNSPPHPPPSKKKLIKIKN